MAKKVYNKLVRDKIPEIIRNDNALPQTRELDGEEHVTALKDKLVEEAGEVQKAKSEAEIVGEIADVYELTRTLAVKLGFSLEEVKKLADDKKAERGGFEKQIFLESVEE